MKNIRNDKALKLFGARVRTLRKKLKVSQDVLAYEAGIPRFQVSRIERGEVDLGLSTILCLAKALEIKPKDLMDF